MTALPSMYPSPTNGDVMKNIFFISVCLSACLGLMNTVVAEEQTPATPLSAAQIASIPGVALWEASYQLEAEGMYAEAATLIRPLRGKAPNQVLAVQRTAWLLHLQGNYNDAIQEYRMAIALNPVSVDARLGITLPLMAQKRWREATHKLKVILNLAPWHYTAHIRLLQVEEAQQQWETLARHAQNLARHYPGDATALVYLARARAWQARKSEAKAAYARVLARSPHHVEATRYLENN